jgi:hypothetical protein
MSWPTLRFPSARPSIALAILTVLLVSACPGADAPAEDTSTGATDSSSTAGTADTDTSGDSADTGTSGDSADTGTSSDTGVEACEDDPPEDIPAVLGVTLEILNDTAETVFVLGSSERCTPFGALRDGVSLPIVKGFTCGCECPGPPSPTMVSVALDPGASFMVTWDGRALASYTQAFDCEGECFTETNGRPQPVEPGPITMTIPVYTEAASTESLESVGWTEERCESPLSFTVDFDLGTEDVMLSVPLSSVTFE